MNQETVDKYIRLRQRINILEVERIKLRDEILADMTAGAQCPSDGPFVINLTYQDRPPSWRTICMAVIQALTPKVQQLALNVVDECIAEDRKEVPQLTIKQNPRWRWRKAA